MEDIHEESGKVDQGTPTFHEKIKELARSYMYQRGTCNIGCEDASLDSVILQKLSKALLTSTLVSLLTSKHARLLRKRQN